MSFIKQQFKNKSLKLFQSRVMQISMFTGLAILARSSFAQDALAESVSIVSDTYNGSMKTYLYVGEAVAAIITLIFTRDIKTLSKVGGLVIFFNTVAALAGI